MASTFSTNVIGKINEIHLETKKGYQALFELISNSIFSIESANISNGKIDIILEIDNMFQDKLETSAEQIQNNLKLKNIIVIDNGIGFNEDNFKSFLTCYSPYKADKGCKGIGRFTCLKVFDYAQISSTFYKDNYTYKREFVFEAKNELSNENLYESNEEILTTIKLTNIKSNFKEQFPIDLNILADLIIEHFFINFITGTIPIITLHDSYNGELCVNDYYKNQAEYEINKESFEISGETFDIYHIKSLKVSKSNKLYLCANNRNVNHIDLRKHIPNLQAHISSDNNKKKWYFSYLTSSYLDNIVNSERTAFNYPEEDKTQLGFIDISKDTLINAVVEMISKYLKKDLEKIEEEKIIRIDNYIDRKEPKYKLMRKYFPNFYSSIPNDTNEDKLEMSLYSAQRNWEEKIKKDGKELSKNAKKYNSDKLEQLKEEYINGVTAIGKACLTEYICKRKAILDILENSLCIDQDTNRYSLEEVVHKLICPMIATSDDLNFDDMNLWIIDEKLSYHYYLASDKTFKSQAPLDVNSNKETDLAIYHAGLIFNNTPLPYQALTIIEFKRPARDDYSNSENPVQQVLDYIEIIRAGKAKDRKGRIISGNLEEIPIYVYIIADLTPSLNKICKQNSFTATPDKEGYFTYHPNYKAYIEVISYNKLLNNAQQRNKLLFDKLFRQ